jgi:cyclophilin family peptidyl-prolyl cis-trans isomerase
MAQVVRFETTVGDFDMVLNPTNNSRLQAQVDNMLQYIENEAYRASWINRAAEGFVLQMGGFYSHTRRPALTMDSIRSVRAFDPVPGEPAAENPGLSNTVGTVAMALSGLPTGGTNQDSGTTSFFVNLTSNAFLDDDFTVFAMIPDMTTINNIMALMQVDRTTDPMFGADPGNLAFIDIPVQDNGYQVFIKRAFVVTDAMTIAKDMAGIQAALAESQATANATAANFVAASAAGAASSAPLMTSTVPEPGSFMLAAIATSVFSISRRRQW